MSSYILTESQKRQYKIFEALKDNLERLSKQFPHHKMTVLFRSSENQYEDEMVTQEKAEDIEMVIQSLRACSNSDSLLSVSSEYKYDEKINVLYGPEHPEP